MDRGERERGQGGGREDRVGGEYYLLRDNVLPPTPPLVLVPMARVQRVTYVLDIVGQVARVSKGVAL